MGTYTILNQEFNVYLNINDTYNATINTNRCYFNTNCYRTFYNCKNLVFDIGTIKKYTKYI